MKKLLVTFDVSFVIKNEFGKTFCPAWGKECKLCKTINHFEGTLVC